MRCTFGSESGHRNVQTMIFRKSRPEKRGHQPLLYGFCTEMGRNGRKPICILFCWSSLCVFFNISFRINWIQNSKSKGTSLRRSSTWCYLAPDKQLTTRDHHSRVKILLTAQCMAGFPFHINWRLTRRPRVYCQLFLVNSVTLTRASN